MKKLFAACTLVAALALFGGSWKWGTPSARPDDDPLVAEVMPVGTDAPTFTADVVSTDARVDHPVLAVVTTADGNRYRAIVMPTDEDASVATISITASWGW